MLALVLADHALCSACRGRITLGKHPDRALVRHSVECPAERSRLVACTSAVLRP